MRTQLKACQPNSCWQTALANGVASPKELLAKLAIELPITENMRLANQQFPTRVPLGFINRMKKGDIHDPLLRQVLPLDNEMTALPGYTLDPLQEQKLNDTPGLLHKYHGRVLILLTGACAINCRYCFRRHFPYSANILTLPAKQKILTYIKQDPSIHEVIYSGGDPLLINDESLAKLTHAISEIPHVTTLRIHTRLPIVLPERITTSLINLLTNTHLKIVLVTHCNHPQEINSDVIQALRTLYDAHITLLNHSVLLKGVNDCAQILHTLSEKLFSHSVLPYYLNQLDPVQGAAHFEVPLTKAKEIYQQLQATLPGYLVPRFVCEKPGGKNKLGVNYDYSN